MSNRVAEYRKAKGMTQRELAERVGVTDQAISNIESRGAQPRAAVRAAIAKVLRTPARDLFPERVAS